ncbi:phosphoribosyl-dephospho-CoA transferase [Gordonia namibiensis NBRC 108229]|uniref:Phosphoribosyl-dephospho-CoA transferase n=2 Tax=Gordonia namibiensis TaxID=168480 RepID=K6WXW4_9ACTN|nr:phosphoribosyl-dephospho-CoA transferase [Gordonia namibiensis NBRC 108229]
MYSQPDDVHTLVTPESLTCSISTRSVAAIHALRLARPLLDATGLGWGPTGSVGFELATGKPTATPDSDLDLLIRADDLRNELPLLTSLHHQLRALPARVDCLVETASGALALAELADSRTDLLLRTPGGPCLVARSRLS